MFWRRTKRELQQELAEAQRADAESRDTLKETREKYRATLRTAKAAQTTNARNHFSERLTEAFGG